MNDTPLAPPNSGVINPPLCCHFSLKEGTQIPKIIFQSISTKTNLVKDKPSEQETKETQSELMGPLPKERQPTSSKNQDFGTIESQLYKYLCNIEDSLLVVFNKLNDVHYLMVLSICPDTHLPNQKQVYSPKGWDFALFQGPQTLVISSKTWMLSKEKQDWTCFSQGLIKSLRNKTPNQGFYLNIKSL